MIKLLIMGESLVEIMRDQVDIPLGIPGIFRGPYPSGAPAICASAAARLGCETALISGVGDDDFGKCITDRLKNDGVDISHVLVDPEISTGCTFVTYFSDGSRKFIFHMGNTPAVKAKAPEIEDFPDLEIMHVMGCSLMAEAGFAQEILKTIRKASGAGARISFDPNIRKELLTGYQTGSVLKEVMNYTSIFLPGKDELMSVTGTSSVEKAVSECFGYPKMEMVLLKNGSAGSTLFLRTGERKDFPAFHIQQIDATGAGDCYDGAFLAGFLSGKPLDQAVKMASAAGALNASAYGPMEGNISLLSIEKIIRRKNNP